jgi:aspartyl protease
MTTKKLYITAIAMFLFSPPAFAQGSSTVDVPMLFYGTRPAVEVMVNGKGPFFFLIDTGAQGMARVDASLVKRLNLTATGQSKASDTSARNEATLNEYQLDSISVGIAEFRQVTALSRNYNTTTYLPHLDGILGFDLFADQLLTLNYPGKRVRIERGELPSADGRRVLAYEIRDGNPYIEVAVGNLKMNAMLDSGNIRGIDFPAALVAKLPLASYPKLVGKGGSISGEFEVKEVRLQDTLSIGHHLFPEPIITFTDVYDEINIGSSLLRQFEVTFDLKSQRVRLIKSRNVSAEIRFDACGCAEGSLASLTSSSQTT